MILMDAAEETTTNTAEGTATDTTEEATTDAVEETVTDTTEEAATGTTTEGTVETMEETVGTVEIEGAATERESGGFHFWPLLLLLVLAVIICVQFFIRFTRGRERGTDGSAAVSYTEDDRHLLDLMVALGDLLEKLH